MKFFFFFLEALIVKISLFRMFHKFGKYSPGNWVCGNDWEGKGWYSMVLDGKLVKQIMIRCPLSKLRLEVAQSYI